MIIECVECSARFKVSDDKIKPKGTKVRCAQCSIVFKVFPVGQESIGAAPTAPPRRSTDPFSLDDPFEHTQGPFGATGMMAPGSKARAVSGDAPEPLLGGVQSESGGISLGGGDNPFERDDPFARTAFGADDAAGGGLGESRFDLGDLPDASQIEDRGGFFSEGEDSSFGNGAFALGSDVSGGASDHEKSEEFVVERFSHFEGGSGEAAGGVGGASAGKVPGLESTSEAVSGLMARGGAGYESDASPDGDVSLLGDPKRAQAMLAGVDGAPGGEAAEGEDHLSVGGGPYFDPSVGGVVDPGASEAGAPRSVKESDAVPGGGRGADRPIESGGGRKPAAERGRRGTSRRARQRRSGRTPAEGLSVLPDQSMPPARVIMASEAVVRRDGGVLQVIANLFLILILVMVGFLGFVAWKNDGLLDFYSLDDMVAAAFGKGEYTPRGEVLGGEGEAAPGEEPALESPLVVKELEQLHFPNKNSKSLFILEGVVVNRGDAPVQKVTVEGVVFDGDKKVVGERVAPTGRPLTEEELLEIVDEDSLKKTYEVVEGEVQGMDVPAGKAVGFSLVFLALPESPGEGGRSFKVTVKDYHESVDAD